MYTTVHYMHRRNVLLGNAASTASVTRQPRCVATSCNPYTMVTLTMLIPNELYSTAACSRLQTAPFTATSSSGLSALLSRGIGGYVDVEITLRM